MEVDNNSNYKSLIVYSNIGEVDEEQNLYNPRTIRYYIIRLNYLIINENIYLVYYFP